MELHNQEPTSFGDQDSVELQDAGASTPAASRGASRVLVADANGVVVLPAGTELGDLRVEGRDLVVIGEDGVRYVIPDGAIIVPQLVIGDVAIPPLNLAALLIGNEPQPAAGNAQSSGGNFASAVGPIQAAYGLGDLLPYTELSFPQPEEREVIPQRPDREPDVVVVTPDQPAGATSATAQVNEAGLPARGNEPPGSNAASNSETTTGTIVFGAPDGLSSISINGVVVTTVGQTITSPNGTLTVTSIAPGVIGYSYTLADNMLGQTMNDSFAVVVTDVDGDVANATLSINVIDDAPDARNDTDSVAAGTYGPEIGNVITGAGTTSGAAGADVQGADGARVTAISGTGGSDTTFDSAGNLVVAGTYGTLTIKTDGSYSYVRTPNTAGGVTDTFTYTLTDGDGDTDTATLVISIGDSPASVVSLPTSGAGTIVDEEGLPPRTGEAPGTAQTTNVETTSGTITVIAPDGIASVQIGGSTVTGPGQVITTPQGSLTITSYDPATGTITYSFTLSDNTTGDTTTVTFPITVTDVDGDSDTKTLTITIVDDMPDAINDAATQSAENVPVVVNVLANDIQGADSVQPSTVTLVAGTLSGTGTLANNGDGTFTYTPGSGETGTVTFDYTITDGDGDTDRATVTITLAADSTPTIAVAGDNTVDEAALPARAGEPAGSNAASPDETAAGTIAITTGGDTIGSLVINGVNVTAGGTVTTSKGVLTVSVANGAYSYSYTLTDNTLSDPDSDTFTLVVTDSDGDPASTTLVIAIADDVPTAADDAAALGAGSYGPVSGSVTANDTPGADGIVVIEYTGVTTGAAGTTVNGQYGTLTIAANGAFSYTRNPGTPGGVTDTFSYTIRDGDGDLDTANLVITIADGGTSLDLPIAGTPGVTQVLEEGLPAGSNAAGNGEFASGSFTFTAPDGPAIVTIDGTQITAVGQTISGAFGTLTITSIAAGAIGYSYELTTNTSGDTTFDDFAVVVRDQDNDSTAGTLTINIVDDLPTANDDVDAVTEDGPLTATGNVITGSDVVVGADANNSDGIADVEGADGASVTAIVFNPVGGGAAVSGPVGGALAGAYGSLTLNADGSYSYVLDNANPLVQGLDKTETLIETFTYTITDGDTDVDTATLTITIVGSDDGIVITGLNPAGAEETVYENDLADGQSPDGAALTQAGSFDVAALDGISVISVGGAVVFTGGAFVPGQSISTGYGALTITAVTPVLDAAGDVVSASVSYSYTLDDNTLTHTGANDAQLTDSFAVSVTDSDGTVGTDTVDITVVDDVIVAVDDMTTQAAADEGLPVTIDVFANDLGGADGKVVASVALVPGSLKLDGGAAAGTLANNGDGTFTYSPATGESGTITFDYSVADGDGDTDFATVTIILAGDSTPSFKSAAPVEVDEDGLASANVDASPLQAAPAESDGTESAIGSGTALFQFGNDIPGVLAGSAVLVDTPALDGQLVTLAGENVVFGIEGGALVGRAGSSAGAEIIRIALTTSATTATAGEVAYGYTVTLSQPVRHATAGTEDTDLLSGVTIEVTDNDGDKTTGSFAVTVRDDVPTAVAGPALSVVESAGPTPGENLLANDTRGADGAAVSHVNLGSGFVAITSGTPVVGSPGSYSFVVAGKGTYVFNADGSWSFDPVPVVNAANAGVDASFSYRITDGDSDVSDATQTVTITDGAGPQAGTDITLTVDDQNLADGSTPAVPVTDTDTITFTPGSDAIASIVFGTSVASLDASLTWTRVSDTQIVGKDGAVTIVTLDLVRTGSSVSVKATLSDNYDAHPGFTADDLKNLGFVTVVATDTDGDTATNKVTVEVSDDVPTARSDTALSVVESVGATPGENLLANDTRGADGAAVSHVNLGSGFVAITSGTPVVGSPGSYSFVVAGKGTYVFNADGSWSFDPVPVVNAANAGVDASFSYRITDGDSDVSDATQTVTITDGAGPQAGTDITLTVDDQNLADGSTPAVPVTDTDTITFTPGSDAIASIVFGTSVASLDASLTWTRVSDTQIVGKDGAVTIVTLDLVRTGSSVSVKATLSDNYDAHPGFTADDLKNLGFVTVVATDTDGDTATNKVTVEVSDDVPTARSDTALSVVESVGATPGENLLANDTRGADGAAVSHVNLGSGFVAITSGTPVVGSPGSYSFVVAGKGTYVFNADGSWSFDPVPVVNAANAGVDASFSYRITDGDSDVSDATQTVTITDGAGPQAGTDITLTVDDQNLADGSTPAVPVTDTDTITFTPGSDAIASIVFGTSVASLDASLTWTRVSDTQIVGKDGAVTIVTLDLVRTGSSVSVKATLSDNYDAHPGFTADDLKNLGFVTVVATDTDGDTATNKVTVEVSDDVPSSFTPANATAINTGTALISNQVLDTVGNGIFDNAGADGVGTITFAPAINGTKLAGTSGTLQSGGADIYLYIQANGSLIASTDSDPSNGLTASLTVFTATLNAVTGTYSIDFDRTIDNGSGVKVADFSKAGAGNTPWKGVDADLVNGAAIAIDAANDPNPDSTDLLVTVSPGGTVNSDSDDIGTSNQFIDSNEFVRIDLVQDLRFDPGKGTSDADGYLYDTHSGVTQATFKIIQVQSNPNATAAIRISATNVNDANPLSQSNVGDPTINTAVNLDHTTVQVRDTAGNLVTTGIAIFDEGNDIVVTGVKTGYTVTFGAQANATFEAFRMENAVGDPKAVGGGTYAGDNFAVGGFAYNFTAIGSPVSFNLPVVLTDGDGDQSTGSIAVTLNPVTPIVLDLDGDGVEFIAASEGAMFDYNSDGNAVGTGWAGADDGILAIDANDSGSVDGGSEIVFGFDGLTDLEGLAAKYDTNRDGTLDANDADFARFGVWQDADSDGASDAGEFRSLTELGITSISLKSDGAGYTAAGGDVTVYGSSSYTKSDGSTGSLADAAFATKAKEGQRTAEIAAVAALAGAVVETSVAAAQPAIDTADVSRTLPTIELSTASLAEVDAPGEHVSLEPDQAVATRTLGSDAPAASLAHTGSETSEAHLATSESHFSVEAIGSDAGVTDHVIAHGDSGSLFAGMAGDGVMAALLAMGPGQAAATAAPADVAATIGDALSDFAGTAMVNAVVDHFAGAAGVAVVPQVDGFDASFMLAQGLGGSAGIAGYTILPDAHDDASALAAAQA
ncbi:Ig-like domain-containing protein [Tsuneonella sp. HG094]